MIETLYYLIATCLPEFILGAYWGVIETGLYANSEDSRINTSKWYIRILFQPSSCLPFKLQLVYGLFLFLSIWVFGFLLVYPMVLLAEPPEGMIFPQLIFAPVILYPLLGYHGYKLGQKKCLQLIKRGT